MSRKWILALLCIATQYCIAGITYPNSVQYSSIAHYTVQPNGLTFYMAYASDCVHNPELTCLIPKHSALKHVDLVYTGYPYRSEDWITNFDSLMQKRIEKGYSIDERSKNVPWNIIRQTNCSSDSMARSMFHGLIFYYENLPMQFAQGDTMAYYGAKHTVDNILKGVMNLEDSLVFEVLEKTEYQQMLVVTDWTGSMYPYGAQVLRWQQLHAGKNAIKGYVLFNDGNKIPDSRKRIGGTGGVYYVKSDSVQKVQRMMGIVAKLGGGGDIPENNLEAVWKGMRVCKGWKDIVMIADNHAGVRDMVLLGKITVPIHIILCGVTEDSGIHPHYLEIARQTKGTLHFMHDSISNLSDWKEGEVKILLGRKYKLKRGKIVLMK